MLKGRLIDFSDNFTLVLNMIKSYSLWDKNGPLVDLKLFVNALIKPKDTLAREKDNINLANGLKQLGGSIFLTVMIIFVLGGIYLITDSLIKGEALLSFLSLNNISLR